MVVTTIFRVFREITVTQAKLTPINAAKEIDRCILAAWAEKRPVYLELPSDIAYFEITVPVNTLDLSEPESEPEQLRASVDAIAAKLGLAKAPALLIDLDADRFNVMSEVAALAQKLQLPVATLTSSKGTFPEQSPLFMGVYFGSVSEPSLRKRVKESDCLLTIGLRRVDSTSGFYTDTIPENAIHLNAFSADVAHQHFEGVVLRDLVSGITDSAKRKRASNRPTTVTSYLSEVAPSEDALTQSVYWKQIQRFLRSGDVIIAEDGTSSSGGTGLVLPDNCTFVTQAIWGSIGYSLGALLGTLFAAPERRHILLIGDGSFQLTAQELSTILRHNLKPYIFLTNNGGYTIERTILGRTARYNDVANWSYADLAKVFSRREVKSFVVKSSADLHSILEAKHSELVFVEAVMNTDDAPRGLIWGGPASAEIDYGSRGPQRRPDAQIPLPQTAT
jgi:indolepyruvate decarboxylase